MTRTPSTPTQDRSFANTFEARGLTSIESKKRLQKNCFECPRAHRRCVFELMNNNQCTRCVKFNLCCAFRVSGMFNILYCIVFPNHFSHNYQLISCCFLPISEQGCRNDLNKLRSITLASNKQHIFPSSLDVSSDSFHCNALTQSKTVSYAFSCHTTDTCWEEKEVESSYFIPSFLNLLGFTYFLNQVQLPLYVLSVLL